MNLQGVAVASDTAVTKRGESGLQNAGFESKIIRLPEPHKIAILHSGFTNLNNVPHLFQVRQWVASLTKPLPTVKDYVDSYVRFSSADKVLVPNSTGLNAMRWTLESFIDVEVRHLGSRARDAINNDLSDKENTAAIRKAINQHLSEMKAFYKDAPTYKGLTRESVTKAMSKLTKGLAQYFEDAFKEVPLTPSQASTLKGMFVDVLLKEDVGPADSKLHIVGFGTSEPYARLYKLVTRGKYAGKLVTSITKLGPEIGPGDKQTSVDCWSTSQNDAMNSFMMGYHPQTLETVDKALRKAFSQKLAEAHPDMDVRSAVHTTTHEAFSQARDELSQPMWDSLRNQPVESLAEFAKAMVTIQSVASFYRGDGTVGGEVETLLIRNYLKFLGCWYVWGSKWPVE